MEHTIKDDRLGCDGGITYTLDLSFCFEWSISSVPRLNYFLASVTDTDVCGGAAGDSTGKPATLQTSH